LVAAKNFSGMHLPQGSCDLKAAGYSADALHLGVFQQTRTSAVSRRREPPHVCSWVQGAAARIDQGTVVSGGSDFPAQLVTTEELGLVPQSVSKEVTTRGQSTHVARLGRQGHCATANEAALYACVNNQVLQIADRFEGQAEHASSALDAKPPAKPFHLGLEAGEHEPAIATARTPPERMSLQQSDVDPQVRQCSGCGQSGISTADNGYVGCARKRSVGGWRGWGGRFGPKAALDHDFARTRRSAA